MENFRLLLNEKIGGNVKRYIPQLSKERRIQLLKELNK
jgi:hypothetical protein